MKWAKSNWVAVLFVASILVTFYVSNQESHGLVRAQHSQLVAACKRTSARTSLDAAGWLDASAARRASGRPQDVAAADRYESIAQGEVNLIPAPMGLPGSRTLAEVAYARRAATLTQRARALQTAGCERAYP